MKINPEKIRDVIGKGGAVIRALTEETGCTIDIGEDGTITIASVDADKAAFAKQAHRGHHRRGRCSARSTKARSRRSSTSARWCRSCRARTACCTSARSRTSASRRVEDFLKEGQIVKVKVLETDEKGRIKLSMKALLDKPEGDVEEERPRRDFGDRDRGGRGGDRDRGPRRDRGDRPPRAEQGSERREDVAVPAKTSSRSASPTTSSRAERHGGRAQRCVRSRSASSAPPRCCARPRGRTPSPGPGEVLIRVAASGVNRPDVLQRKGAYPLPPGASDLPGLEVAGSRGRRRRGELAAAGFKLGDGSARWSPAAATPNCASRRWRKCCRCPRA